MSGNRLGLGISIFLVGGELGRGIWPLFASIVAVSLGLHYLWLLTLPAAISVPLLWSRLPQGVMRDRNAKQIVRHLRLRPAGALVSFSCLRALTGFGAVTFLPVLWHLRGHSLVEGAALITLMLVVGVIGNIGGGHLADRLGRRPVLIGSSVLGALLLTIFLLSAGAWQWAALAIFGIVMFAVRPVNILIGQDIFPENPALGSGVALGLSNGLAAAALVGLDPIAATYGPEAVLWLLVAVQLLAAAISIWLPLAVTEAR